MLNMLHCAVPLGHICMVEHTYSLQYWEFILISPEAAGLYSGKN